MSNPLHFYFDFSSPYGYIASEKIEGVAAKHGRTVTWHPFLLGVAFKSTGGAPLPSIPIKGKYALKDIERSARFHEIGYRHPENFPISAVNPSRAFYWMDGRDPLVAKSLAQALFRAYFVDNKDISNMEQIITICHKCGIDQQSARSGIEDSATKERLRQAVEMGMAIGVFGSPYIIVDGEPFWGVDRLDHIEKWLANGGF